MKYLFALCVLGSLLTGCHESGTNAVDNRPTRDHNIGRTSDQARTYAAGGGNLSSSIPYTPPSRR